MRQKHLIISVLAAKRPQVYTWVFVFGAATTPRMQVIYNTDI